MAWKPDSPAIVLKHDRHVTIYGYRIEVVEVDTASDMITYKETCVGMRWTCPRVDFLALIGRIDESNALRRWWIEYCNLQNLEASDDTR